MFGPFSIDSFNQIQLILPSLLSRNIPLHILKKCTYFTAVRRVWKDDLERRKGRPRKKKNI